MASQEDPVRVSYLFSVCRHSWSTIFKNQPFRIMLDYSTISYHHRVILIPHFSDLFVECRMHAIEK